MHSYSRRFSSVIKATKKSLLGFAALLLTLMNGASVDAQVSYTYVDLGNVIVAGINNAGQIAGHINTVSGPQGVLITPLDTNGDGKPDTWYRDVSPADSVNDLMTLLPVPPGHTGSIPRAINSSGEIAGETRGTTGNNKITQQAFFTGAAGPTEVVTSTKSAAFGINNNGVLAGWYETGRGYLLAATWKKTVTRKGTTWTQTSLGAPSGYTTCWPWAINNDGAVAADANGDAVVWLPSALYGLPQGWTVLPSLGVSGGTVRAINNNGKLAGSSNSHASLWTLADGSISLQDLHPTSLANFDSSFAYGLNNAPDGVLSVVGTLNDNTASVGRPFLWRSDTQHTIVLNDVITAGLPAGLYPWSAKAVNDSSVIIGYSVPNDDASLLGQQRAFVLIPNP